MRRNRGSFIFSCFISFGSLPRSLASASFLLLLILCCVTAAMGSARGRTGGAGNGSGGGSKAREGRRKVTLHIAL